MSAESIEFATIKADHFMHCETPSCCVVGSRHDEDHEYNNGHCLPYLLAVEAKRLAGKVARVEALSEWLAERGFEDEVRWIDAALADQPEQVPVE